MRFFARTGIRPYLLSCGCRRLCETSVKQAVSGGGREDR
jgi:hypothetical protein